MSEDQVTVDLSSITETYVEPADYIPLIGDKEYEMDDTVANREQNPIMEKLLMFMNDPFRKSVKFSHDISTHDRIMVHKFVQDNNLTCESTGNNLNHEFVVGKVISDNPMVKEDAVTLKSSDGSNINTDINFLLDYEYDSEVSHDEMEEVNVSNEEMAELTEEEDSHEELSEEDEDTLTACAVCGCSGVKCSCSAVGINYVIRRRSQTFVLQNNEDSTVIYTNSQELSTNDDDNDQMKPIGGSLKRPKPRKRGRNFDISSCNQDLTLWDLKLDSISCCYKTESAGQCLIALRSVCKSVGVTFQVGVERVKVHKHNSKVVRAYLLINDVLVCNGYGKTEKTAKESALKTSFRFLQYKGLTLWDPSNIPDERSVVRKHVSEFGGKDEITSNFERVVEEFIDDEYKVLLRVDGQFVRNSVPCWRKSALMAVCNQYFLNKTVHRKYVRVTKVNSIIHKMYIYPVKLSNSNNVSPNMGRQVAEQPKNFQPSVKILAEQAPISLEELAKRKFYHRDVSDQLKDLRPLKLDGYQGIITNEDSYAHKLFPFIEEMTKAVDVPFVFEIKGPYDGRRNMQYRANISINNMFVAKGYSKTNVQCKSNCAKNTFYFLVSIGLQFIFEHEISADQIREVERKEVEASSIKQQFDSFIEDKTLLKLKFCFRLTESENELFDALCELHSLTKHFNGTGEIVALKRNSHLHKMELLKKEAPVKEILTRVITKEELSVNSSIRDHVEKFVNDKSFIKLRFPDSLDVTQKELIELLADKHKLKQEIDESNQINLVKETDNINKVPENNLTGLQTKVYQTRVNQTTVTLGDVFQGDTKKNVYRSKPARTRKRGRKPTVRQSYDKMIAELGAGKSKKNAQFSKKRKRSNMKLMNKGRTYELAADKRTTEPSSNHLNSAYLPKDTRYFAENSSYNYRTDSPSTTHVPKQHPNYQIANTNHLYSDFVPYYKDPVERFKSASFPSTSTSTHQNQNWQDYQSPQSSQSNQNMQPCQNSHSSNSNCSSGQSLYGQNNWYYRT